MRHPALFPHPYRPDHEIRAEAAAWLQANPGSFDGPEAAVRDYFFNILVPPSGRWALKLVDKAGSTSVLRLLHQLEWGTPFTVEMEPPDDINPESVVHRQLHAEVLRRIHQVPGALPDLPRKLRIATVRHPGARAVSAFLYLCTTQERRATWMVEDRIRMGALVGFDWTRHGRTPQGFLMFLDYCLAIREAQGPEAINSHWRPQWTLIRPDLFQPDLVGRCEDMGAFAAALSARLDRPAPAMPQANAQGRYDPSPYLRHPGVAARLANLYLADYESFDYAPDEVPG